MIRDKKGLQRINSPFSICFMAIFASSLLVSGTGASLAGAGGNLKCSTAVDVPAAQGDPGGSSRLIPLEDFFRNPERTAFQLSPDGTRISFLMPWKNRLNIHVQKIGETEAIRITSATERDIFGYLWVNDSRLVYVQDKGGDENFRVYGVGLDGTPEKCLTPFKKVRVHIVDELEDDEDHILVSMNRRNPRVFDVYRLDVVTGALSLVAENPGNVSGWITDHEGRVRAAITSDGVKTSLLYRETDSGPFRTLVTTDFRDKLIPLAFTPDNRKMIVASNIGRDRIGVFDYDPATAEFGSLIFEHPEVDISSAMISRVTKKVVAIYYTLERREYHFTDPAWDRLFRLLRGLIPKDEISIADMSRDERRLLIRTYSDKTKGSYYFYDRMSRKLEKLQDVSPWLLEEEMAPMTPISYQSGDGLEIHGYLTLPLGVDPVNLPVVVNPHGGPWVRDSWGFNPEVQFLANRGYAVLQMNYRGSTGYGRRFWTAGFKQWGLRMQDDITDGIRWLVSQGIADPKRIGIYGASYGGYAVLAGLAFTPEIYACGVDYVGVSNIFTLLETLPPYWELGRKMMYEMIGDPETEKDLLMAASPVFHSDSITSPLMVVQGANDPRVKKAESDQIVEALKARGIDVPYMVKENEGHGFHNEENRFDVYRAMEGFFAKHLGGRSGGN